MPLRFAPPRNGGGIAFSTLVRGPTGPSGSNLNLASQAEAEAGASNTVVMSPLRSKQLIDATAALTPLASQAEAEAGASNSTRMSPLRVAQQTTARLASQAEAEAGTDNVKLITSLRVLQAITAAANTRLSKTGAYTVASADNGKTIALSGNTLYTLTFNAVGGYSANHINRVVNEDGWTAGRGKVIALSGGDTFILWPTQSVIIYNSGSAWRRDPSFERVRLPGSTRQFYLANGTGNDTLSDGMASGTGAWNTVQGGLYNLTNFFDFSPYPQTAAVLNMLANENGAVHYSTHGTAPGAQGGAVIQLNGNGAVLAGGALVPLEMYHGAILQVRNIRLSSTVNNGAAVSVNRGAYLYLLNDVIFEGVSATGGADILCTDGAVVDIGNSYTISGTNARAYHIRNSGGTVIARSAITATVSANQSFTDWINADSPGSTNVANITWSVGGASMTGRKYSVFSLHVGLGVSTAPGGTAGVTGVGGQVT